MCISSSIIFNQRGAVTPMVAILLVALLLIVALVIDIGLIHNAKLQLQQAVDSAALAGSGQLNGLSDATSRAVQAAQVAITANDVLNRDVNLDTEVVSVSLGHWDGDNLGAPFDERWSPGEGPVNAVYVRAEIEVDHAFYLFAPSTTLPVDALAVQDRTELTLPLALISCIPPTGPQEGELNVCGIKTYSFTSNENTAGWTALTLGGPGGASQQEIADLFDGDGAEQFNRIAALLNSADVERPPATWDDSHDGCEDNYGESVHCGLGGDFVDYQPPGASDPFQRYSELPRYITMSSDEQLGFWDIALQDSRLYWDKSSGESFDDFQDRLQDLYLGTDKPYGDNRFVPIDPSKKDFRLILQRKDTNDIDGDGDDSELIYLPDINKALDYAGYPPVAATTGSMTTVMGALIEKITPPFKQKKDIQFSASQTDTYPPFDDSYSSGGEGETLLFTIPVIFAGLCGNFDPKSFDTVKAQESSELHYVGLANFLVTRIWKGGDCYECREPVVLSPSTSLECNPRDHVPKLLNDDAYACPVKNPEGSIAFEGLVRPPGFGGGPTGIRIVTYLVE